MSVRGKLLGIAIVGAVLTLVVGAAGLAGVHQMGRAEDLATRIDHAERLHRDADRQHDVLKHGVLLSMLVASGVPVADPRHPQDTVDKAAAQFRTDLLELSLVALPQELTLPLIELRAQQEAYIAFAQRLSALAGSDIERAVAELNLFAVAFDQVDEPQDAVVDLFSDYHTQSEAASASAESRARIAILVAGTASILTLLGLSFLLGHKIVSGLNALTSAARAQQSGDAGARAPVGADEIGSLGEAFNAMADTLGSLHTELVDHNSVLEDRVRERTKTLEEAQETLLAGRDDALAASQTKSEFLATMSHEIRTPMNGVIGLTELLLDTPLTETQSEYAEGVRASGEALLAIINDILDFSKIEAGKLELETVDFDLAIAIEDVAGLAAHSARAKGLELVASCHPEVPTALRGDVGRLRQILLNLVINAVKFTDVGEVVLRASLAEQPTSGQLVIRFEVADTGVGITPATAERLFLPFSQADTSTTRRYGGTGLGLAICRRLAEAMGGTVGVDSQPSQGSTFWLRLPFAHASEPVVPLADVVRVLDGRRVLVVDDNRTNRLVLASQLQAWDITVELAADAESALDCLQRAAAESSPYDVALLDMGLPGMDGLELAAIVSGDPALASVRLLLLSSVPVEATAAAEAGLVARLVKPVRMSNLYDALVRALNLTFIEGVRETPSKPVTAPRFAGHLLIVEDNAINQLVAKGMLARLGYGCDVAGNGIEALQSLERRSYDAVLMDCHMPQMDGLEATAEIRRREAGRSHVPIIAMTASVLVGDRKNCLDSGMDDYMSKPVKVHDLDVMLKRWVARDDLAREPKVVLATPPTEIDGVLDLEQIDVLRHLASTSGDKGLFPGLVDDYLDEAPSRLAELRAAVERKDVPALEGVAHEFKGSSATIGATGVASACDALEEAAFRGEMPGPEGLERVAAESARAAIALRAQASVGGPGDDPGG